MQLLWHMNMKEDLAIRVYVCYNTVHFCPLSFMLEDDKSLLLSVRNCIHLKFWTVNYRWMHLRGLRWLLSDLCDARLWKGCLKKRKFFNNLVVSVWDREVALTYIDKYFSFMLKCVNGNSDQHALEEAVVPFFVKGDAISCTVLLWVHTVFFLTVYYCLNVGQSSYKAHKSGVALKQGP